MVTLLVLRYLLLFIFKFEVVLITNPHVGLVNHFLNRKYTTGNDSAKRSKRQDSRRLEIQAKKIWLVVVAQLAGQSLLTAVV